MSTVSILAGVALLCWVVFDVFLTVFAIGGGAGPQTGLLAERAWRLALRLHEPTSARSHSVLRCAGPIILLLILVTWITELIFAWSFIYVPTAFVEDSQPVGFQDRLIFGARMVVGRGTNSTALQPTDGVWDFMNSFGGLTGVTFVSLGLAYVLPVLAGVAHKRSVATHLNTLGNSVESIREMVDEAEGGGQIAWHLETLTTSIATTAERHRSYPVLHYFHSADPHAALAPAMAKLVVLVEGGLPSATSVDATVTRPLARALHDLLGALQHMGLERFALDHPGLARSDLEEVGIEPLSSRITGVPSIDWMRAYVAFDGWEWAIVTEPDAYLDE